MQKMKEEEKCGHPVYYIAVLNDYTCITLKKNNTNCKKLSGYSIEDEKYYALVH